MPTEGAVETAERVPFNVVDEFVHLLDTEAEPWSIQLEVRVTGTLDEDRLRTALSEALDRHPMARARKAPTGNPSDNQYCWEITTEAEVDPLRVVDCPDDEALHGARCDLQSRSVPLAESPPAPHLAGSQPRRRRADGQRQPCRHGRLRHAPLRALGGSSYSQEPDPVPDVDPLEARSLKRLVGTDDTPTRLRRLGMVAEKARDTVVSPARISRTEVSTAPATGSITFASPPTRPNDWRRRICPVR